MYEIGERIIYGSNGVCSIEGIQMLEVPHSDEKKAYYVIKPMYQDCTIAVPVDTKMFMRPIITQQEALCLIDSIPQMEAEPYYNSALRQLQEHYENKMSSHSCRDLIELALSLRKKKAHMMELKKKFGAIDERYLKRAEDLLFGEFSVVLEIPKTEVRQYISNRVRRTASA